ncbi:beta-xylosidase [Mesorhizobium australicum WSM2073]|uniref:Beta-xylosidase n=1 Tax=Mesorhizobium australicum (strain HAMBI 3006 / LMG 24608 / WSM2073) TaxID=754035 RepID=L0KBS3_MESAW|nr:beta-xylosidase [Mesorhizobium australicum WSM2073]
MEGVETAKISDSSTGVTFRCDLGVQGEEFPHFWEHTVGSGHATLALRADWQAQMRRAHDELGFRHVRFHGLLDDDMGTLIDQDDKPLYSFFNADQIFDFLLSIGMRPFVELSFTPTMLSSSGKIVFRYRANVSAPKDYDQWSTLISKLVAHWVDRYGLDEVRQWFFEVWNEPNLEAFGSGKQEDYFKLYAYTARAIKSVDTHLKVGGPATADNAWIDEFIAYCGQNGLPADFVSTHHYPTDAFGQPGDDTEAQLSKSTRSVLREEARTARRQAGDRPLYYTEWCTSSNPRDPMHDEPYAAAFIVKTVMEARGLVQGYSYWTFSDIFEENYFPSLPFHGGFGLMNLHGVAKPAYRAFEMLHGLGTEILSTQGNHPTVDSWSVRDGNSLTVLISNFALPRHPVANEIVHIQLENARRPDTATIRRVDAANANPKALWVTMGSPDYLSRAMVEHLHAASAMPEQAQAIAFNGHTLLFDVTVPAQGVAAIRLEFLSIA